MILATTSDAQKEKAEPKMGFKPLHCFWVVIILCSTSFVVIPVFIEIPFFTFLWILIFLFFISLTLVWAYRKASKSFGDLNLPKTASKTNVEELTRKGNTVQSRKPKWCVHMCELVHNTTRYTLWVFLGYLLGGALSMIVLVSVNAIDLTVGLPPEWPISPRLLAILTVISTILIGFTVSTRFSSRYATRLLYAGFDLPPPEYEIFSQLVKATNHAINHEIKSTKKVLSDLRWMLKRYFDFNVHLQDLLKKDMAIFEDPRSFCRGVTLSQNSNLRYHLINIGLALVHREYSEIPPLIEKVEVECEKFKDRGRLARILTSVQYYRDALSVLLKIVVIILATTFLLLNLSGLVDFLAFP